MKLSKRKWKIFKLSGDNGIFKNYHGKRLTKDKRIKGTIPLITAGEQNQGVADFISNNNMKIFKDCITVDMFGNAFYHEYACYGDDNIYFFINNKLSKEVKLFIVNVINSNKSNYSYGKQFRQRNADMTRIMLPVKFENDTEPDWVFMEKYILEQVSYQDNIYRKHITSNFKELGHVQVTPLSDKKWKEFFIVDIFNTIQRGKRLTKLRQVKGETPYISSTSLNNGVDNYVSNEKQIRKFNDCLTIANSGSVGISFYHPYEFVASDHVTHLKRVNMNKYVYLFIATLTNRLSEKYNFNREINDKRISREKIILPVNGSNEPDYEYMELYVKNVMIDKYKKIIQYKQYKN